MTNKNITKKLIIAFCLIFIAVIGSILVKGILKNNAEKAARAKQAYGYAEGVHANLEFARQMFSEEEIINMLIEIQEKDKEMDDLAEELKQLMKEGYADGVTKEEAKRFSKLYRNAENNWNVVSDRVSELASIFKIKYIKPKEYKTDEEEFIIELNRRIDFLREDIEREKRNASWNNYAKISKKKLRKIKNIKKKYKSGEMSFEEAKEKEKQISSIK